ncbi:MAG: GNAT family N-acetyltransferase [Pseudomonadota bacterium]
MIDTRTYTPVDEEAFLSLYRECLSYYDLESATPQQEARIMSLLNSGKHMSCEIAFDGGSPLGFATWVLTFPSGTDVALYMKELFVSEAARGKGVGRALIAALLRIADVEGCSRIDWQTDKGNAEAQRFYESIGAPLYEKVTYRVPSEDFAVYLQNLGDC